MGIIDGDCIRGRVGNRIYYVSNGKQCVRMAGRRKPATEKQLSSQHGIRVAVDFLNLS
ncbi:hypothetical protein [Pedobacter frigoris]|uniref:hypothetical protein n=1 Tax=Pedobacter frigoris TaxID=2571272 RepID=UPI00145F75C2|nr:hypothetical protein [Pedobacter frigoris]